jgi:hypothetical protein
MVNNFEDDGTFVQPLDKNGWDLPNMQHKVHETSHARCYGRCLVLISVTKHFPPELGRRPIGRGEGGPCTIIN